MQADSPSSSFKISSQVLDTGDFMDPSDVMQTQDLLNTSDLEGGWGLRPCLGLSVSGPCRAGGHESCFREWAGGGTILSEISKILEGFGTAWACWQPNVQHGPGRTKSCLPLQMVWSLPLCGACHGSGCRGRAAGLPLRCLCACRGGCAGDTKVPVPVCLQRWQSTASTSWRPVGACWTWRRPSTP